MIINCINCTKKFEVDSSLIPENGRTIQCGSCNHVWFYKPEIKYSYSQNISKTYDIDKDILDNNEKIDKKIISENQEQVSGNISIPKNDINKKITKKKLNTKKNLIFLNKFLSYFLVSIISFVSLIILLDTLKSPLSEIFPSLEILLYNLFETIKDIYLFLENLII